MNDKENKNLIHWGEDNTFIITDPYEFSYKILPKEFRTENYSSFIRQLNEYGFHKKSNIEYSKNAQFENKNFTKDKTDIKKIKRKAL